ncbi:phage tail spike protein [Bacillus sp. FSL M8-0139]|uniref:phage tail spike protein n=1 Tax=Bacillus sp. FSL M8-0139 TaxID=2921613 RepID=UPI0030F7395F
MRTPSGILHVVDFKTDQIISVIQSKDYWDDKRHWEIKNNIDTLEFKTFDGTPQAVALQQQNLVLKEVRDGRIVPYVINNEVEKESNDRTITVHASGAWVQIAKDGFIKPQRIESETVNTFIDIALADSKWKRGKTDYSSFHTMTIDEFIDPLAFLKKIATLFELEIQYRVEVVGSQITGWYVDMIRKRGQETGKEVLLGKDLVGVRRIEHSRDICTALVGFVRDEGDKLITIESINNGLPYIVDNDAFQRWNEHGKHKFGFYTPETEENITPERLLTLMKTELAKRVSSVSYEVEAQSIGRIFGLAHELINEGDTIRIKDTGFTPKLYLEARAIVGDESHTDPSQDQYVFGDYREITDANEELRKMYNRIRATLGNKANKELLDRLEELVQDTDKKVNEAQKESKAAKELAEKVQENLKNNTVEIIEAVNPPTTNLKIGKTIWRDISNGKPGVLKVWNGKDWELLIPDVESIKKDTLEQVNKDIKLTKEELNKKVEEAQEETTGQFNKVTESLQKVTRTISDVQRDQGEIDKKVTKFEQDSEGFKTSIETLTKNSTDTTSKINTLVNDVDGNKRVISEVKESVANFNDDVRNLLVGSKSFDGALTIAQVDNRWWLKSADKVKISKDVFQGNTVVETQSSWTALAYNFKDLVDRKVVKVGDKVTYSIFTRVKGLPNGQDLQHTFYFAAGATGIRPNKSTNQWQRVSVSFVVTAGMMASTGTDNESHFRIEPDVNPPSGCWYQQSSPQLTISSKEYSWRPAPEDIADGNVLTKVTTEIKEAAGKISEKLTKVETKVNNDKSGGRNLLLDSNTKYEKIDYLINPYSLTENFVAGEEYTFVIKGSVPQGQQFGIWQNGGTNHVGYATSTYANGITYVTFKAVATTSGNERRLNLYNYPNNATKATVEWVALYKGNKPQDWTPAPENQVTNDEFTKKTTEIEKSVDGIKESIKTVEKTQTFFDERVNTVEKNAEGTTASVKKLQETQTAQGKTISEATTTIGQHSEALKLTMKKKDVEDYVGGLGSINDLRNASFAQGFKYWTQNGNSVVIDSSVTYRGYTTAKLHATGLNEDKWYSLHQTIDVTAGEDVVASGYFMSNNIGQGFVLEIEYLNAQGSRVSQSSIGIDVTANSNWIRSVVSGTVPAGAVKARYKPWVRRNGTLWIALPMLQRGKVATEFWLHPKDQTDIDKMIDDIANKVATEKYNQKVTELERSISATEKGVSIISGKQETFINETYNAYVKKTESKLEVLDEGILAQILKDGIVTAINMSPGKITINAAKLDINADTMVKWLTAKGIDTNLIRISGDKITIDGEEGVIINMLDFLFKDEWGTKTTAISRRNLIADPDFSSVTKKNIGHSDYYGFEGGYGLTWKSWGNVVIEKNTHIFDYEQMVNAARVDMYNYPEAIVNNGIHPGNEYTASAHFRTAMINGVRKTGKPRIHVCCVKFRDNVSYDILSEQKMDFPEPSTYYGEIRRYSFTFKVPTNYIPQQHALIIKVCSANADMRQGTAICVSGVTLYSGKYASMYNWDRAAAERADGIQPFNAIAVGGVNNNIAPAPDGQTFDISTEKEVKIFRNIRAMQGINLGGGGFQQWGHIRFTDGNMGSGFYASTPSGWKFNALG